MAEQYDVQLSRRAQRELKHVDRQIQRRILAALVLLRDQPRPATVKALVGHPDYLRIRVGDYRIVYTVDDGRLIVLVLTTAHRREVYGSLP